jgi:hypothetical protein
VHVLGLHTLSTALDASAIPSTPVVKSEPPISDASATTTAPPDSKVAKAISKRLKELEREVWNCSNCQRVLQLAGGRGHM